MSPLAFLFQIPPLKFLGRINTYRAVDCINKGALGCIELNGKNEETFHGVEAGNRNKLSKGVVIIDHYDGKCEHIVNRNTLK